jgi:hypothetical protein
MGTVDGREAGDDEDGAVRAVVMDFTALGEVHARADPRHHPTY